MNNQDLVELIIFCQEKHPIDQVEKRESFIKRVITRYRNQRTVKKVNRALGIHLRKWQIDYIFYNQATPLFASISRGTGKSLAHILFLLLNPIMNGIALGTINFQNRENAVGLHYDIRNVAKVLFADDYETVRRQRFFMSELSKTREKLESGGIKTNTIIMRRVLR